MALTQFPIETDKPKIDVTLPVGKHVLELVVEDSAGLRSTPDTVVITVVRQEIPAPKITDIRPDGAKPGDKVEAEIRGENLEGAEAVLFFRTLAGPRLELPQPDDSVQARILEGGTANRLPLLIAVARDAPPGPRSFTVKTPAGTAASPKDVVFTVVEIPPTIQPTIGPTIEPTIHPTIEPTILPTIGPTIHPTIEPTIFPTIGPTILPTIGPTILPTIEPTIHPTIGPTIEPTILPTIGPTIGPTILPTIGPTIVPTIGPTILPTIEPTILPTIGPTILPTIGPTIGPIIVPPIPSSPRGISVRRVSEVKGIGPTLAARLEGQGITTLDQMAALAPGNLADILKVSEVRAMGFVDEARRLLAT